MVTSARTRFRHARFYITFRCNARCGYCNVWQDPIFLGHDELGPGDLQRCLDQIRELGVEYVDFTGGEPSLHRQLAIAVRHAKEIGLSVEVTTNALRFDNHADNIMPYVDILNISLDTLSAERYHAIRGVDALGRTVALVERLRGQNARNIKLIAVVTNQTVAGMDDLISFAQANRVPVYLSPMFEYFEGQSECRDSHITTRSLLEKGPSRELMPQTTAPTQQTGDRARLLAAVRAHAHTPYTIVNLHFLRHIETLDPTTPTACGAGSRILTIGPDGRLLLPCYHEWNSSLAWDRPYLGLIEDPEFVRVRDTEVGQRPGCRRCAVFPYIGLASSYRLTVEFLVQAVTTEINKIKSCLQGLDDSWASAEKDLGGATERLLGHIAGLSLRPGTHPDELYYFSAAAGRGAVSDLAAGPVSVEEVLADHANEDCWRVQRTPHRIARQLYVSVLPALVALADGGVADARHLALTSPHAHLCLWEAWLDLFLPGSSTGSSRRSRAELTRWCLRAGDMLATWAQADAARSVAAIAMLTDAPVERLKKWGGVTGHEEELFFAKVVMRGLGTARRMELAPIFSSPLAAVLIQQRADPQPKRPRRVQHADFMRAANGDPEELANLSALGWWHCLAGDTLAFRKLVREWKATSGSNSRLPEGMLLAAELHAPAAPLLVR